VFAAVDPKILLVDPVDVERKIARKTCAINIFQLGGNICDMDAFMDIGKRYGIAIGKNCSKRSGLEACWFYPATSASQASFCSRV
jgi:perosamine synthetase